MDAENARRLGTDAAERISAGCYGALVSASTLIGLGDADLSDVIAVVALTNVVYFATHVFAYSLGDVSAKRPLSIIRHHLAVSAPMVSVTFLPLLVVVVLVATGVDLPTALLWGVGVAMAYLVAVATVGARLRGYSPIVVILTAVGAAVIAGLLIVAKLLLH
ncbi:MULTISPECIES: hypothetical protein [Microbacterium]|jgi:hypothetical protein|uniref:Uncharacterized protein n=1 Tax=Microbacterium testaceum TaxID=2033 RepID=A0A147FA92_MICTE|nr:hypothetical protein [Microbacterium testaceum]KTS07606.1 hypothetical protein NS283_01435 [Microbacterium testaceum]KTS13489.1 hypothetical protein RSA3_04540 [Microbacterium testaceum]KTS85329.1 hypothetical protein NS183_12925 [Microbacterium testaceum]